MMQAENQSYLPGAGEAAVGDRKSQTPMPSSLQATMSANQWSLNENFKNN